VAVYENSDLQKVDILKENKGKSGIYRWTNNATGKSYVGSSVNLYRRLRQYYDYSTLSDPKCNMLINRALFLPCILPPLGGSPGEAGEENMGIRALNLKFLNIVIRKMLSLENNFIWISSSPSTIF
jgi:hypothetical protein